MSKTNSDTEKYKKHLSQIVAINSQESVLFLKNKNSTNDMIKYLEADIVLIEGFKREKTYPKIVCLRKKSEKAELIDGLQLCTAGLFPKNDSENIFDYCILNDNDIKNMAKIVIEKSFKLPDLNCGACGFQNCYELAKEIVQGNKVVGDCSSLESQVVAKAGGKPISINELMEMNPKGKNIRILG